MDASQRVAQSRPRNPTRSSRFGNQTSRKENDNDPPAVGAEGAEQEEDLEVEAADLVAQRRLRRRRRRRRLTEPVQNGLGHGGVQQAAPALDVVEDQIEDALLSLDDSCSISNNIT